MAACASIRLPVSHNLLHSVLQRASMPVVLQLPVVGRPLAAMLSMLHDSDSKNNNNDAARDQGILPSQCSRCVWLLAVY